MGTDSFRVSRLGRVTNLDVIRVADASQRAYVEYIVTDTAKNCS